MDHKHSFLCGCTACTEKYSKIIVPEDLKKAFNALYGPESGKILTVITPKEK